MSLTGRGPLGLKKPKPERNTAKSREYMRRVKMLPCVICGAAPPSDAHHVICGRYGQNKTSDFDTIPLCKRHHQNGPEAIHNGKRSWVEKYGKDYDYIPEVKRMLGQDKC